MKCDTCHRTENLLLLNGIAFCEECRMCECGRAVIDACGRCGALLCNHHGKQFHSRDRETGYADDGVYCWPSCKTVMLSIDLGELQECPF